MATKRKIPTAYDPEGPQIEPLTIAECVCRRPRMYTSDGSLAQLFALFVGYDIAGKMGAGLRDQSPSRVLCWLAETCFHGECDWPSQQCEKIIQHFGTEVNALNAIASFLKTQRAGVESNHHTTTE